MSANQFGNLFRITTFGESHGPALGVVIDGCPSKVRWQDSMLRDFVARRRPGGALVSGRQEQDEVELLSGVFSGLTLGTPIAALVRNHDARSADHSAHDYEMRQGHATDLWQLKFGHSDPRGSGRASGRETVSRVIAGAVARMLVEQVFPSSKVIAFTTAIGDLEIAHSELEEQWKNLLIHPWSVDQFPARFPSIASSDQVEKKLRNARENGESFGGVAQLAIVGIPSAVGEPVFRKLKNQLADAFMSIGATMGLEFGEGFSAAANRGSTFHHSHQNYGGLRGGLSTGEPVWARVAFKPTSSRGEFAKAGRHDPCIVPRAIPVLEAMTWLVLADLILHLRLNQI